MSKLTDLRVLLALFTNRHALSHAHNLQIYLGYNAGDNEKRNFILIY